MNALRACTFAVALLLSLGAAADEPAPEEVEAQLYSGFYRYQDQRSEFRPNGTKEYWWVAGEIDRLKRLFPPPVGHAPAQAQPVYVVLRGTLLTGGRNGWRGNYQKVLTVEQIVELKELDAGERIPF